MIVYDGEQIWELRRWENVNFRKWEKQTYWSMCCCGEIFDSQGR
jgi:hypothetical protein